VSLCCFAAGAVIADEVRMNLLADHDELVWGLSSAGTVVCQQWEHFSRFFYSY
jgi:hypothetical protein